MIKRVFANKGSFKSVDFVPGFNIVWADRTKEATQRDSRNGLGKSTLIEIIHFCLGAKAKQQKGLLVEALKGWEFSVELEVAGQSVTVTRCVDKANCVRVEGACDAWPIKPKEKGGRQVYSIADWNEVLGAMMLGLSLETADKPFAPTFRSAISYFIRRHKDAFSTPFEHHRKQIEWDKQVNNAFLIGLAWEDAAEIQTLRERKKGIENLRRASKSGVIQGVLGSLGDLEARKVRLQAKVMEEEQALFSFRVHPQYTQIEIEANNLTEKIHEAVNANMIDQQLIDLYEKSLSDEQPPQDDDITRLYREAGVNLPGLVLRRFEDVQSFHNHVIQNRRSFLAAEINRLEAILEKRDSEIATLTDERAKRLEVLQSHGALDEFMRLQSLHSKAVNELNEVVSMIENWRTVENGLSEIKIAQEVTGRRARQDYDERATIRERAISLFNKYSEILYSAPGRLVINVDQTGFKYDVEIERSGSAGISNMKVFCYDLMLATLWAGRTPSPRLLIHDSTIYDGVDERQRALALETAAQEAGKNGFQYICTLNSDYVPWTEFSRGFDLRQFIRLTLTDQNADGCLLGIRF